MDTTETEVVEGELVDIDDEGDAKGTAVYEVGYHLVPLIAEENLPKSVEAVMNVLKYENVVFVGERFPSKITLAYPIAKHSQGKRSNFDSAYFGWVAFETGKDTVSRIKAALDSNADVLRYLIVRTDREAVNAAMTGAVAPRGDIGKPKRAQEAGGEVSEAALQEALESIEKEDAKTSE